MSESEKCVCGHEARGHGILLSGHYCKGDETEGCSCTKLVINISAPSPKAAEKCRKCGNPNGYDNFVRQVPPFYCCGKCGEPEKPEPRKEEKGPKNYKVDSLGLLVGPGIELPVDHKIWFTKSNLETLARLAFHEGSASREAEIEQLKKQLNVSMSTDTISQNLGIAEMNQKLFAEIAELKAKWEKLDQWLKCLEGREEDELTVGVVLDEMSELEKEKP